MSSLPPNILILFPMIMIPRSCLTAAIAYDVDLLTEVAVSIARILFLLMRIVSASFIVVIIIAIAGCLMNVLTLCLCWVAFGIVSLIACIIMVNGITFLVVLLADSISLVLTCTKNITKALFPRCGSCGLEVGTDPNHELCWVSCLTNTLIIVFVAALLDALGLITTTVIIVFIWIFCLQP